jgi:hypothetical protein
MSPRDLEALAFSVYARMRAPAQRMRKETQFPWELFRIQPPFLLRRFHDDGMSLHVLWDESAQRSFWSDDIGSILTSFSNFSFDRLRHSFESARLSFGQDLKHLTLTFFADGVGARNLRAVAQGIPGVDVFAMMTAPAVQARFADEFADDVIAFDGPEVAAGGRQFERPTAACVVMSARLYAYRILSYNGGGQEVLRNHAVQMSRLSWLSVKPGFENRVVSYPPHMAAMLGHSHNSVFSIARFEFLPTGDGNR